MMARNPGMTAVAVLALALGIGANTAMFSVVNTVLLRPLPFKDPDRLLWLWPTNPSRSFPFAFTDYSIFSEWRKCQSLESISAYSPGSANLTTGGDPDRIALMRVNSPFFSMLGVRPFLGRDFLPEEDVRGARRVAILDYKLWQRRFGSDPKAINRQMQLDGEPYTIVGVLPAGFEFTGRETDLFVPIARSTSRTEEHLSVGAYARLKPGATAKRVEAEIDAVYRALEKEAPHALKGWTVRAWRVRDFMVRDVRLSLLVLLGAVALVLLIACANVANLLLARAGSRQRELAMRTALGAGRGRLIRQLLTESTLLGLLGGGVGLLLAWWGVKLLPLVGPERFPFLKEASIDIRVLGFTLAATLLTGLLFGAAPALSASRARVYETLKEGGAGTGESLGRNRFRSALVVAEVALALLLMIGASLMMRSLLRLQETRPGFNPEGLLTASISLPMSKYPEPAQRAAFYNRMLDRIEVIPGVKAASMTSSLPLSGHNQGVGLVIEGAPPPRPGEVPILYTRSVDRRYFQAMQVPLKRGRFFTEQDSGAVRVAVINETMAKRYWPDKDPVGKRFGNGRDWITVVGVAGDLRHMSLAQTPDPEYFEPYPQNPRPEMVLTVRTGADPMRLAPALRAAVREVDSDQPVSRLGSMSERVSESTASRRFSVALLAIFAALALALAAVGIYGVISFSVTRRTREIGIRMAMGARTGDVVRMVVGQAVLLAAIGVALGIAGGLALTRVIGSLLYNVSATDPATFVAVSLVLIGVAALASYIPARRAARIDPTVASAVGVSSPLTSSSGRDSARRNGCQTAPLRSRLRNGTKPSRDRKGAVWPFFNGAVLAVKTSAAGRRRGALDQFHVDHDGDFVADHHAAAIQRAVPGEAPVLAVNRRAGGRSHVQIPPLILDCLRGALDRERDFLRRPVHRQVADQLELARSAGFDAFRLEGQRRVLLHVEEIRAFQVLVTIFHARVDGGGVDGCLDRGFRRIGGIVLDAAGDLAELAFHVRDHHVADGELRRGVRRVDLPGFSSGRGRQ